MPTDYKDLSSIPTDTNESFCHLEKRLGISKEINDTRHFQLGSYPSASFYSKNEIKIDLESARKEFDRVASNY
jgi:hypothetical protein